MITVSTTWMTPFFCSTSAVVTLDLPPLASVIVSLPGPACSYGQIAALHGLERRLALAVGHRLHEVGGRHAARDHVIGQDLGQRRLALGLHERVDRAGRQLGEGVVGGSEDRERTGARQCVDQTRRLHGCDQRRVILRVDGVLDDVL
jgi:hypothetical protein